MTVVPLHLEPDPDDPELLLPYVDGTVDGRPCRFLLDTGAAKTRIPADSFTSGLPVVGTRKSHGLFGSVIDELVTLESLEIGPIVKTGLTVVRTVDDGRPKPLGMDALGDMAMVLDFGRAVVEFAAGGTLPADRPMRRGPNGQPFLELEFAGAGALACWDTGAAVTVVDSSFHAAHEELFTPAGTSIGHDAAGHSRETPMYQMRACTVGGITLAPHKVAVAPLPQSPIPMEIVLGYPAIRQYVWTMDYPLSRWSATPAPPPPHCGGFADGGLRVAGGP